MKTKTAQLTRELANGGAFSPAMGIHGAGRQAEWYRLLDLTFQAYTRGESSSLPVEMAGSLLNSLYYTVQLALKEAEDDNMPLQALYDRGRAILDKYLIKARRLFAMVQSAMLPIDAPCYIDAIEKGAPSFFKAYDPSFFAHETPADFDYPVSVALYGSGVTWMASFLEAMYWESLFCRRFPFCDVESTLKAHGLWGQAVPINVFEPVFACAMLCSLLIKERPSLRVTREDHQGLLWMMGGKSEDEIRLVTNVALIRLIKMMDIKSEPYMRLLFENAGNLVPRLYTALKNESLGGLFPQW